MTPILATFDWQTAVAGAIVGLATIYLTRHYWKAWTARGKQSCGGCGTCSASEPKQVISIAPLPAKKPPL
jgi:translation initiation factor RLI1